jgi:hypothetical protein
MVNDPLSKSHSLMKPAFKSQVSGIPPYRELNKAKEEKKQQITEEEGEGHSTSVYTDEIEYPIYVKIIRYFWQSSLFIFHKDSWIRKKCIILTIGPVSVKKKKTN